VVAVGCGSNEAKSATTKQPSTCEIAAENAAAAAVARSAYNAGTLGKPATLASYFKGVKHTVYLDTDGRLRPWSAFNGLARFDLEAWMAHVESSTKTVGDRMYAARMRVRSSGSAKC
jgi:hypothetical protein